MSEAERRERFKKAIKLAMFHVTGLIKEGKVTCDLRITDKGIDEIIDDGASGFQPTDTEFQAAIAFLNLEYGLKRVDGKGSEAH